MEVKTALNVAQFHLSSMANKVAINAINAKIVVIFSNNCELRNKSWVRHAYKDYALGKQTLSELSYRYKRTPHTLRKHFDELDFCAKVPPAPDHPVPIVFDATFFGRTYGIFLFRSNGTNLYWKVIETETSDDVQASLSLLEDHDYKFASFTVDGRKSALKLLREQYPSTPVQLCHFHFIKTVIKHLTTKPKTELGKELYKLARKVGEIDSQEFAKEFNLIKHEYKNRLSKKIKSEESYDNERKVINNINRNLQYLFAYKKSPELNIPNTTNSCEGAFAHLKQKIKIHRGLRKDRREKMIFFLLTQK